MNNAWFILLVAGLFEVGFTTFMKLSEEFTQTKYTIAFTICAGLSFLLLSKATAQIPLGTAYAIWTGIGALGTAIIGMVFFKDPISWDRIILLLILISAILGLKLLGSK